MRWPSALIASLMAFLFWWALYSSTPIGIRGIQVAGAINDPAPLEKDNMFHSLAKFCEDMPMAFRPMTGWLVTGVEKIINMPLFKALRPSAMDSELPIRLASTFILGLGYIYAFAILATTFPAFYGAFALFGFALIPMAIPYVGLSIFDPMILFFWSMVLRILSRPLPDVTLERGRKKILIWTGVVAMLATWTMENTGVGFSIMLFLLALMQKTRRDPTPYWRMWAVSTVTTLTCLGISWLLVNRNPDAYWNMKGMTLTDMYRVYGQYYSFSELWECMIAMVKIPATLAVIATVIAFYLGDRVTKPNPDQGARIFCTGLAALIGFSITTIPGRYMVGMNFEWTRQLLPFGFLGSWTMYGAIMALTQPANTRNTI